MLARKLAKRIISYPFEFSLGVFPFLTPYVEKFYEQALIAALKESDTFTSNDWEEVKTYKLWHVLSTAGKSVPFWRKYLQGSFNGPQEAVSVLKQLPISSRALMKQLPLSEKISWIVEKYRFMPNSTSGSTGEPFSLYQDRRENAIRRALTATEFYYNGITFQRPALIIGLATNKYLDPCGYRFTGTDLEEKIKRQGLYCFIMKYSPKILITTPSLLERFKHFLEEDGFEYRFHGIKTIGEELSTDHQKIFSSFFKCRVFAGYATRETSGIATQCLENNFHLTQWLNYVEIIDSNGRQLPFGVKGQITVTYFENFVMPFIRYSVGDQGMITNYSCPCGRKAPILIFSGREPGLIILPNGGAVPILAILTLLSQRYASTIIRFQIRQRGNVLFFIFIPTTAITERFCASLLNSLHSLFKNQFKIQLVPTVYIPPHSDKTPLYLKIAETANVMD